MLLTGDVLYIELSQHSSSIFPHSSPIVTLEANLATNVSGHGHVEIRTTCGRMKAGVLIANIGALSRMLGPPYIIVPLWNLIL